jgi:hypothetical protein
MVKLYDSLCLFQVVVCEALSIELQKLRLKVLKLIRVEELVFLSDEHHLFVEDVFTLNQKLANKLAQSLLTSHLVQFRERIEEENALVDVDEGSHPVGGPLPAVFVPLCPRFEDLLLAGIQRYIHFFLLLLWQLITA